MTVVQANDIQLYDASSIDAIAWPTNEQGDNAKKFLIPLLKNGLNFYIRNVNAKIYALKINEVIVPVVIGNQGENNSYICSAYAHYIANGHEGIRLIENKWIASLVKGISKGFEKLGTIGKMCSVVYVNHWLFSTDIYPKTFSHAEIKAITQFLKQRFPNHAIAFRSLTEKTNEPLLKELSKNGFHLIKSRYVLYSDTSDDSIFTTRIIKSDLKLLREMPYQMIDQTTFSDEEITKMHELYHSLYIEHHSKTNPQYTIPFIKMLIDQEILKFKVLQLNGVIEGVAGYYERNGIFMCPFFGYDKDSPQSTTIYRLLNISLTLEAKKNRHLFHQSSGASFYKTIRRAKGCFESMAIYSRHLPWKQHYLWTSLKLFVNWFAPPYMKKY